MIAPQTSRKHKHKVCLVLNSFQLPVLLPPLQWTHNWDRDFKETSGQWASCIPSILLLTSSSSPPSGAGPLWASWKRIFFIFRYWRLSSSRTASFVRAIRSITTVIGRSLHRKWCCAYRKNGVKGQSGWAGVPVFFFFLNMLFCVNIVNIVLCYVLMLYFCTYFPVR